MDEFDMEVHMKAAQVTKRPLAVDGRRLFLGLSGLAAAVAWPQDASASKPPRVSQGAAATYPVTYHRTKTVAHPVRCCFIGLIGVATMLVAGEILPYSRSVGEILFVEWLPGSPLKLTPGTKAMGVIAGRWAWTFAFAAFSLIGSAIDFGTPALAQVQRSGEPSEVSQPNLTGDWGGLRSYLERLGITFTLSYTNDFMANVHGGIGSGAVGIGVFQPQVDLDLKKLVGFGGRQSSYPRPHHPRAFFQSDVSRQYSGRVESRSWTRGTALFTLVRTECLQ
jgi:hypothetical protein